MNYRYLLLFAISINLLHAPSSSRAEIYKWVDENGKTHFSNSPQDVDKKQEIVEVKIQNIQVNAPSISAQANTDKIPEYFSPYYKVAYAGTDETPLTLDQKEFNRTLVQYLEQVKQANKYRFEYDEEDKKLTKLDDEYQSWRTENCKRVEKGGDWQVKVNGRVKASGWSADKSHSEIECSSMPSKFQGIKDTSYRKKSRDLAKEFTRDLDHANSTKKTLDYLKAKIDKK